MAEKAKFRFGQVVHFKSNGTWVKVTSLPDRDGYLHIQGDARDGWAYETELRPLTAREIGPRPRAGTRRNNGQ
jgi:hypothetical protein